MDDDQLDRVLIGGRERREIVIAHVHEWPTGHPDIAAQLAFRDRLRASPADRASYEALKRSLATRDWPDMNDYADAKGALVREIRGRAAPPTA